MLSSFECVQALTTADEESTKPFPYALPLDPNTRTLASIPLPLFYPGVLALAAVAGLLGSTAGKGLPGEAAAVFFWGGGHMWVIWCLGLGGWGEGVICAVLAQ